MAENKVETDQTNTPHLGELRVNYVDEDGEKYKIAALDKRWATRTEFTEYLTLIYSNGSLKSGVDLSEWEYEANYFRDDMKFLLSQPHHIFWSYMVHQKAALSAIISFLKNAIPFYLDVCTATPRVPALELYEEILCLVVRIICRLITNKESPDEWLDKEHMRNLIYSNYLISVPMLFDILVAVGDADKHNKAVLEKIFSSLLKIEPQYKEDLRAALAYLKDAFRSIQTQAENEGVEGAGGGAIDENAETPYDDVVLYTLDCAYSLSVLLEVCPEARPICDELNLGQSVAHFYDTTIPYLYKNIFLINKSATSLSWLNQARIQFLKVFRSIAFIHIEAVLSKPEESMLPAENFIALLTECLSEQTFVVDYQRHYAVELDMDILSQACKDLDEFKANFVSNAYKKEAEETATSTIGHILLTKEEVTDTAQNSNEMHSVSDKEQSHYSNKEKIELESIGAATSMLSGKADARDIDLEVTAVLEIMPDLGTGFVRRVLSRYDHSEDAIAAILEENLPPDLVDADRTEEYIPPDPQDKFYLETGVRHLNIYDGDPYDVMTQDNPQCIIKQGKGFPNAPQNACELLDDKRDLAAIRHRYKEYTLVSDDEDHDGNEYDDEYDDSYDAILEGEPCVVKSKELKVGLADVMDDSNDDENEDKDEEQKENGNKDAKEKITKNGTTTNSRMNFCENPEDVRARYEAKQQAKWANRNTKGSSSGVPKSHDVVGAPKGKGQDNETIRNRNKKEINKSSRANHNRKAGAAFKRNKGMIT